VTDLSQYVKEKDFEVCATYLQVASIHLLIICLYRSPIGDYTYFLNQLELVLNRLYRASTNIILCGDFNVNFIETNTRVTLLESLMALFIVHLFTFRRSTQDSKIHVDMDMVIYK